MPALVADGENLQHTVAPASGQFVFGRHDLECDVTSGIFEFLDEPVSAQQSDGLSHGLLLLPTKNRRSGRAGRALQPTPCGLLARSIQALLPTHGLVYL